MQGQNGPAHTCKLGYPANLHLHSSPSALLSIDKFVDMSAVQTPRLCEWHANAGHIQAAKNRQALCSATCGKNTAQPDEHIGAITQPPARTAAHWLQHVPVPGRNINSQILTASNPHPCRPRTAPHTAAVIVAADKSLQTGLLAFCSIASNASLKCSGLLSGSSLKTSTHCSRHTEKKTAAATALSGRWHLCEGANRD